MIRKFTLLFLACLGCYSLSMAQKCGSDSYNQQMMASDPAFAAAVNQFNAAMITLTQAQQSGPQSLPTTLNGNKVWEIPVVVHVIDTGGAIGTNYNPTSTAITNLINYLTQAFEASYPGHLLAANGGIRIPIVFKLAQRDPSGNATTGIIRINAGADATYKANGVRRNTPNGITDANLKSKSYWPNTEYYNVWIVNKIDGTDGFSPGSFTAGYAQLPVTGPNATDGTVMLASMVSVGNSVITHEIGHAFNLRHVFEGGTLTTCPPAGACNSTGDFCCDTEPIRQSPVNACPSDPNPCAPFVYNNTQKNFMDYSNCPDRFTIDQRFRVWNSLMNTATVGQTVRSSLISSLGATPPSATPTAGCAITGPTNPTNNLGPRRVAIIKNGATGQPDTFIMNAISGGYYDDGNLHHFDRTEMHRAELVAGQLYNFRPTVGFTAEHVRAYIDYNNDGDFVDARERIYFNSGNQTLAQDTFSVPLYANSCVALRMRVISDNSSVTLNSCAYAPTTTNINGQAEDYEVIVRGGVNAGGVIVPGMVSVYIPSTIGNPSCDSTFMQIRATKAVGTTPVWFQWFKKTQAGVVTAGPSGATDSVWTSTGTSAPYQDWTFGNLDTVWVRMALPGTCGSDTTLDSVVLYRPDKVTPSISITNTAGTLPTCVDETVTLGIQSAVNPGGSPAYQWQTWNGAAWVDIVGANASSYNVLGAPNGARYRLRMTSSAGFGCAGTGIVFSNEIQVNHTTKVPTVTIALTTGLNPGCPGQLLTYSVTANTVAGSNPTYQWKVNGTNQSGATATNFSGVFNAGDVISVEMTSSSGCAVPSTASNSAPAIQHQTLIADVTIAQISGGNPVCSGHPAVFTATPVNAGTNPQFQWLVNNNPVIGANSPTLNISSLLNNDAVACILIATDPCVQNAFDTSNYIMMQVTPSKVPKISFTITAGNNPGCLDSLVEFTATTTDAGTTPDIEWLVNSFPLNLNSLVYSTTNLLNNDVVTARVIPTDGQCYLPDTAFSAPMTMVRSVTPEPPIISLINNMLITNKSGSFVWFGPAGQLTGGDDGKYHPTELGKYYARTNNNGCWSKPSNVLTITLLDINSVDMAPVTIFPNPTSGKLNIEWGRNVSMNVAVYTTVGQKILSDNVVNQQSKVLDMSSLANGIYFVVLTDEQGRTSTTRITITK